MTLRRYRKNRRTGNRARTQEEQARFDAIKAGNCMACMQRGIDVAGQGLVQVREIEGGDYAVTSTGLVRTLKVGKGSRGVRWLKQQLTPTGYLRVQIRKEGRASNRLVHRLVAEAFLGHSHLQVNHIDGDKTHNCIHNLEYVTRAENMAHAKALGLTLVGRVRGEKHHAAKYSESFVRYARKEVERRGDEPMRSVADRLGISLSTLEKFAYRETWRHI